MQSVILRQYHTITPIKKDNPCLNCIYKLSSLTGLEYVSKFIQLKNNNSGLLRKVVNLNMYSLEEVWPLW